MTRLERHAKILEQWGDELNKLLHECDCFYFSERKYMVSSNKNKNAHKKLLWQYFLSEWLF